MSKVQVGKGTVGEAKVALGQEFHMEPSDAYAGFNSIDTVVVGLAYASALPTGITGAYIDTLEMDKPYYEESNMQEQYDIEMLRLTDGLWVGYTDEYEHDKFVWVPQELFLEHSVRINDK